MLPIAEENRLSDKLRLANSLFRDEGITAAFRQI